MFDIQQFLISKQIGYRKEGSNVGRKEINICCPFCAESKYHCGINSGKNVYHCWVCGVKGDLPKLISKLLAISYIEAKEIISPTSELKKVLEERNKVIEEPIIIPNKDFKLPKFTNLFIENSTNDWQVIAYQFLKEKYSLSWKNIVNAKLHYCYFGNKYKNSIIIPIYKNEILINYLGRCWDKNSKSRYNNCPNEEAVLNIHRTLYNIDSIKIGQDLIILVEGVFDCIKVGLDIAVASFGTEVSQEQKNLLIGLKPKKLIILADNDPNNPNTTRKAQKLCDYLSPFLITKCIEIPFDGKDPADLNRKEIDNLLNDML